ncbi:MAG: helix-turn-helix transcriptional regulator [Pseudomonadota bacterium]|nr:helix-turn-helix transcriptional regulator [Pseudomonadota bacterium]
MIFSSKKKLDASTLNAINVLLPYLDTALGRVAPLPGYRHPVPDLTNSEDYRLSSGEIEIMNCIKVGRTNSETAAILGISIFTVKNGLQNALKKLHVYNRIQAVSRVAQIPSDLV